MLLNLPKVQSIPPILYPMSVVSVVSSPNVMATISPVKPKTSPGALVQPSLCQVLHTYRVVSAMNFNNLRPPGNLLRVPSPLVRQLGSICIVGPEVVRRDLYFSIRIIRDSHLAILKNCPCG